ncbi:MAG: class I SAM-dependent methyltransferase [Coriobacteriia bacterium]
MAPLFWTGKLSVSMRLLANANCLLALVSGAAWDTDAMRRHMRSGYDGEMSDDVRRYDELCLEQYSAIARALLDGIDVSGLEVVDIGCGTGALAFECLARGAKHVTCADVSALMLESCREKAREASYGEDRIAFHLIDDTSGQLDSGRYDAVLSSMVLGLVPDPEAILSDAVRLIRPGGTVAVATHGPEYDWEPTDAAFRAIPKKYVLGYRIEFWPQSETLVHSLMDGAGLTDVRSARRRWTLEFSDPGDAFDFFCASSSAFWYAKIPAPARERVAARLRSGFYRRNVDRVTHDIVFGYGRKKAT